MYDCVSYPIKDVHSKPITKYKNETSLLYPVSASSEVALYHKPRQWCKSQIATTQRPQQWSTGKTFSRAQKPKLNTLQTPHLTQKKRKDGVRDPLQSPQHNSSNIRPLADRTTQLEPHEHILRTHTKHVISNIHIQLRTPTTTSITLNPLPLPPTLPTHPPHLLPPTPLLRPPTPSRRHPIFLLHLASNPATRSLRPHTRAIHAIFPRRKRFVRRSDVSGALRTAFV